GWRRRQAALRPAPRADRGRSGRPAPDVAARVREGGRPGADARGRRDPAARRHGRGRPAAAGAVHRRRGGPRRAARAQGAARAARRGDPRAARARASHPGAVLRGRDDDGRDRRGHRRVRIARVAAALAGAVAPAHQPAGAPEPSRGGRVSKILSQEEIDALLTSAADLERSGRLALPDDAPSVMVYNFRRPDRVSKEQIRSLHFLHDRFARNISTSLSAYLRTVTDVSVMTVEQFTYSEFLMSLPDPTAFYAVSLA